jgi:hypothetical protein
VGRPVFGESILELRRDWPTVCGRGSQRPWRRWVASLSSVGTAEWAVLKRFQTSQRAAIFFSLDLCPVGPARMCRESYGWMSGIGSLRLRR